MVSPSLQTVGATKQQEQPSTHLHQTLSRPELLLPDVHCACILARLRMCCMFE